MTPEQIHLIVGHEIGAEYPGDKRYYNKFCSRPTYPGGDSGVTVGIGYDLGYNSSIQIRMDWEGKVNGNLLAFMLKCVGRTGNNAKLMLTPSVKGFVIDYDTAMRVFNECTLPRFQKLAEKTYPGLNELNETTQAVIVGLIYNRGASLSGDRRTEMAALVPAVAAKDYEEIAFQIDKMKRLWVGTTVSGLVLRREKEAQMIRESMA